MHVDVPVGTQFGAFAAADTPILDDDLERLLSPDRTDWALSHAKRVAAGTTRGGDQESVVVQAVADQPRDTVVGIGAGGHARVAPGAIIEIDEEKILRFEQTLIEEFVELQTFGQLALFGRDRHRRPASFHFLAVAAEASTGNRQQRFTYLGRTRPLRGMRA